MVCGKIFLFNVCLMWLYSINNVNGENYISRIYTAFGCSPIFGDSSNAHPIAYDCDKLFTKPDDKCYFNGRLYGIGEELPSTEYPKWDPCYSRCRCTNGWYAPSKKTGVVECHKTSCPQRPGLCYPKYSPDECCPTEHICRKAIDNLTDVHECVYKERIYKEGQMIYTENDYCICTPAFDGTPNKQWCRKKMCPDEFTLSAVALNIISKSAPALYADIKYDCPSMWFNPNKFPGAAGNLTAAYDPEIPYKCKYGHVELSVGQQLIVDSSKAYVVNMTCTCEMPPLVTCYMELFRSAGSSIQINVLYLLGLVFIYICTWTMHFE